nr:serine protease 40-like [Peromyscus maniculatus bairdii]
MPGTRAQPSGQGRRGACLLAALLLCSSLLPLHAQDYTPTPGAPGTLDVPPTPKGPPDQAEVQGQGHALTRLAEGYTMLFIGLRCLAAGIVSTVCGKTSFQGKIFGGQMAKPGRWPWQASLRLHGSHICGAVLIDKNWVAGAAHCFQRSHNPRDYNIRLGYTKLSSPTTYSRELSVYKLIVHKDYDKFYRQGSDIVLMQLESPVEFSSHILPACVPDKNTTIPSHKACWASGWGHLREDGEYTEQGDSGGPLVCLLDGSWYLVGLTSWSASCETPIASPSVFARVSYFDNWIKEHKKASPDPEPQGPYRPPPHQRPPSYGARPPPYRPRPPGDGTPWNSDKDQGTIICMALLSSQVLLLQLV